MKLAVQVMNNSVPETRKDKNSPNVGAVLVNQEGKVLETASRGEIRHGDHAEFTLLDKKCRDNPLDKTILFVTLEPCAPGSRHSPKLNCAERIVNARIAKVWVGMEDPDPTVDRKGLKYLEDNGIEVHMFDSDLQKQIRESNKQFIAEAEERAKQGTEDPKDIHLSPKDEGVSKANLQDFSDSVVKEFIEKAGLDVEFNSDAFIQGFLQLELLQKTEGNVEPTGWGLLLFGERP